MSNGGSLDRRSDQGAAHDRIKALVIKRTGMSYFQKHEGRLIHAIEQRVCQAGHANVSSYYNALLDPRGGGKEFEALASELTIGETYFFRGPDQFDWTMRHIIPERMRIRGADRQLRIWCAGCSSGAEPYSIAMRLQEEYSQRLRDWRVKIVATDINRALLNRAAKGIFSTWELRDLNPAYRDRYFDKTGTKWQLRERFGNWLDFQWHNLIEDPVPSLAHDILDFDIVLCRNVMIYFDADTTDRILQRFKQVVAANGWLLIGSSDAFATAGRHFRMDGPPAAFAFRNAATDACSGTSPPAVGNAPLFPPVPTAATPPARALAARPDATAKVVVAAAPANNAAPAESSLADVHHCMDRGDWPGAEKMLRDGRQRWQLDPAYHVLTGLTQEHLDDHAGAMQSFRMAIYLDRDDPVAEFHLGRVACRTGDAGLAARSFRNAADMARRLESLPAWPELVPDRLAEMAETQMSLLGT